MRVDELVERAYLVLCLGVILGGLLGVIWFAVRVWMPVFGF